jgi:serine/threonine protein kinase
VKIASALETAHRTGLLHRDIKPSNILVTTFGSPVLADFGIASSIAGSSKGDDVIAMSVPWSAPEVVEERTAGTVATEVWALGSTLYTMLAGRTPFEVEGTGKNSRDQLTARISKARYTPIARTDIPARLQAALARSMSKDPAQRQASMLEFATELQYVQYELGLMPTPLEVAADGWDSGGSAVDFGNSESRGPVQSTVATESRRASGTKRTATERARDEEEAIFAQAARPGKSVNVTTLVWIGVGVAVLAAVAIAASIIIGGL